MNKTTVYDWLKQGARLNDEIDKNPNIKISENDALLITLSNNIKKALAEAEMKDLSVIAKASEKSWQAAAWRLERRFPDRWGRKLDVSAKTEIVLPKVIEVKLAEDK